MIIMRRMLLAISLAIVSFPSKGECAVDLSVVSSVQNESISSETIEHLSNKLEELISETGTVSDLNISRFFISGKFGYTLEETLPGPPIKIAIHSSLTLFIGDTETGSIYASTSIELRGVGNSVQRAYINALKPINPRNDKIIDFIKNGKEKIIAYYDRAFPQIIEKSRQAASIHQYDKAIWLLIQIPECSKGWQEAYALITPLYQSYINFAGQQLLAKANAAWSSSPTREGAQCAFSYLIEIDPESSSYAAATTMAKEIAHSICDDRHFELRQKHNDKIDLARRTIQAAMEIGRTYGMNQRPSSTTINWIN